MHEITIATDDNGTTATVDGKPALLEYAAIEWNRQRPEDRLGFGRAALSLLWYGCPMKIRPLLAAFLGCAVLACSAPVDFPERVGAAVASHVCPGCATLAGACEPGDTFAACGLPGSTCSTCGEGASCLCNACRDTTECTAPNDCNDGNPCHAHACECGTCSTADAANGLLCWGLATDKIHGLCDLGTCAIGEYP